MQDHVQIVRALIEHWNAGDRGVEAISEYFDPAIELESPFSSVTGEPYQGYAGVEHWMRDLEEHFAEWRIGVDEVRQTANQVIAIVTINARGRASDIDLQFRSASVHHFGADHRLTRIRIYPDVNEALAAVGLEA
jgi:SnoaL-like protein